MYLFIFNNSTGKQFLLAQAFIICVVPPDDGNCEKLWKLGPIKTVFRWNYYKEINMNHRSPLFQSICMYYHQQNKSYPPKVFTCQF